MNKISGKKELKASSISWVDEVQEKHLSSQCPLFSTKTRVVSLLIS